ncbi:MAG: NUDIX domain-containing protein [Myxococcota bacterium]
MQSEDAPDPERPATPIPSATVMLVRDGTTGVEVFLMERSAHGPFGGLHVFPGGKVDGADHAHRFASICEGPSDGSASESLGLSSGGLSYWVACIRECFEEAGILLARGSDGQSLRLQSPEMRRRYAEYRDQMNSGEAGRLEALCLDQNVRLAADQLAYVSHWITPVDQPKRFNTRFFVARAPAEQEALHDGHETVESLWIRPEAVLKGFSEGQFNLISPTLSNLESISGFETTEALLEAKRQIDPASIPTILPRLIPSESKAFDEILDVVGYGGQLDEGTPA